MTGELTIIFRDKNEKIKLELPISYPQKNILAQYFELLTGVPIQSLKKITMKKTMGIMGGIALSFTCLTAVAQENWEAQKNPTVDSIAAKYKDKLVTAPAAPGQDKIFPVIGRYESATNPDAPTVYISLDAQNKGLIWIEGLPQGKIKGLLTKSPSTYKIPSQKNEEGKDVPEGTLIYDRDLNTLSICIGRNYVADNPASVFAEAPDGTVEAQPAKTTKSKKATVKAWVYTGTKTVNDTAVK